MPTDTTHVGRRSRSMGSSRICSADFIVPARGNDEEAIGLRRWGVRRALEGLYVFVPSSRWCRAAALKQDIVKAGNDSTSEVRG